MLAMSKHYTAWIHFSLLFVRLMGFQKDPIPTQGKEWEKKNDNILHEDCTDRMDLLLEL